MPDPKRLIRTIQKATDLFQTTSGRRGSVIHLNDIAADVLVAGDLHGNLAHFQCLLDQSRLDRNPHRHLVLQELIHGDSRYPNGGCKSHQLVDLVAALKCQYPDRVHFVLGNHEFSEIVQRPILKGGVRTSELFRQGINTAYGTLSGEVFAAYVDLFQSLPIAIRTTNGVFISHSYPEADELNGAFDTSIFDEPSIAAIRRKNERSLHNLLWGRDGSETTAQQFAALAHSSLLITGHMPCPNGFRLANSIQLILDSSRYPACYCLFSARQPMSLDTLRQGVRTLG